MWSRKLEKVMLCGHSSYLKKRTEYEPSTNANTLGHTSLAFGKCQLD